MEKGLTTKDTSAETTPQYKFTYIKEGGYVGTFTGTEHAFEKHKRYTAIVTVTKKESI